MSRSSKETFQRSPHDRKNPYTMISRDLLRDPTISPNCRWLLSYLLSNADGWVINFDQIASHVKSFIGQKKLYRIIKEAIDAGYMKREHKYENNLRRGVIYYVFECPQESNKDYENSNNFSDVADFGTSKTDASKTAEHKNDQSSLREEKNKQIKEKSASPVLSADASELSLFLFSKIKKLNEKHKEPNMSKWSKEMDGLLRIDKRTPKEVKEIIEWVFNDPFWKANILSPSKLREKFDTLFTQKIAKEEKKLAEKKNPFIQVNKDYFFRVKKEYPGSYGGSKVVEDKGISNINHGNYVLAWDLDPKEFKQKLHRLFGVQL